ncbi:MAG: hypothetical protein JRJ39_09260, partial [Deltaproteobacteria bacterium]|nr:hypothetical protein [Deltaproteobacteria bacterium]
ALAGGDFAVSANVGVNVEAEIASKAGAIGLVIVSRGGRSGLLAATNARRRDQEGYKGQKYFQAPLPIPTVVIAEKDYERLAPVFAKNPKAAITIKGRHKTNIQAFNVLGVLQRGEKWIVVTTPSSGWFSCGGERGPGVALFLGLARWAANMNTKHSLIFIANSGHELDNMWMNTCLTMAFTPKTLPHGSTSGHQSQTDNGKKQTRALHRWISREQSFCREPRRYFLT